MSLLLILSILSPLVAIVAGFKIRRETLLWYYPLTGFLFDVLISFLRRGLHIGYKWPANLFILVEFLVLSFVYRRLIFKNQKLFYFFVSILSLFFTIHTVINSVLATNKVGASIFIFCYILYGLAGLYTILKKQQVLYLERSWFFWLNIALIIYASGNFFLLLFRDYLTGVDKQLYLSLWNNIFLVLNIIKNLLLAVSLYHLGKDIKHEPR